MQRPLDKCNLCKRELPVDEIRALCEQDRNVYCMDCWDLNTSTPKTGIEVLIQEADKRYNEPAHYHQYEIDTIEFLQRGFPPEVFKGFALGSLVKYAHRHELKGGREDLVKCLDFAKRLLDWHDKTHS